MKTKTKLDHDATNVFDLEQPQFINLLPGGRFVLVVRSIVSVLFFRTELDVLKKRTVISVNEKHKQYETDEKMANVNFVGLSSSVTRTPVQAICRDLNFCDCTCVVLHAGSTLHILELEARALNQAMKKGVWRPCVHEHPPHFLV